MCDAAAYLDRRLADIHNFRAFLSRRFGTNEGRECRALKLGTHRLRLAGSMQDAAAEIVSTPRFSLDFHRTIVCGQNPESVVAVKCIKAVTKIRFVRANKTSAGYVKFFHLTEKKR